MDQAKDSASPPKEDLEAEPTPGVRKAGEVCLAVLTRLQEINLRLETLRQLLRSEQPKKDGVVLLELANCGKKCTGCPHIRWKQWRWHPKQTRHPWQAHPVPFPLRKLRRSGVFAGSYPKTYRLITEVQDLAKKKEKLVKALSDLNRALGRS